MCLVMPCISQCLIVLNAIVCIVYKSMEQRQVLIPHSISEYLDSHNFESLIYKTKDPLCLSKTTPIMKQIKSSILSNHSFMDPLCSSNRQNKLEFIAIQRKFSDEPLNMPEETAHPLVRKSTLESEYKLLEMEDKIDRLDAEIQAQFKIMKEYVHDITNIPIPCSTPLQLKKLKTLVLDLDETLIHSITDISLLFTNLSKPCMLKYVKIGNTINYFITRPFLKEFLASVANEYNIVVYK